MTKKGRVSVKQIHQLFFLGITLRQSPKHITFKMNKTEPAGHTKEKKKKNIVHHTACKHEICQPNHSLLSQIDKLSRYFQDRFFFIEYALIF